MKFDNNDFDGIEYNGNRYTINGWVIVAIKIMLALSPFGMFLTVSVKGEEKTFYTWAVRVLSIVFNLNFLILLTEFNVILGTVYLVLIGIVSIKA